MTAHTSPASHLADHDIVPHSEVPGVIYEKRPAKRADGSVVPGLFNAWIWLDNPKQYNSYTTDMVKGVIRAFRTPRTRATSSRSCSPASATRPSAPAGTKEYAEYYAGNPQEYRQYMRPVQRHGLGHPRLRQAGHRARQRHAHRRRTGNRHGLRFHHRAGPRQIRPGRTEARFGGDRRRDRLPLPLMVSRARHGIRHALRAVVGAQGLSPRRRARHRPGAQGRRQVRAEPAGRDAALSRRLRPIIVHGEPLSAKP